MLKNLVFDMGGVLIDLNRQACVHAFAKIGFADIDHYINEFSQEGLFFRLEEGTISLGHFFQEIRNLLGKDVTDDSIREAWMAFLLTIPQKKLQQVRELRKHYRVFLLSNTNAIHFPYICTTQFCAGGYSLEDYFEKCYLSYELHLSKPNEEIFRYLLCDAGICAEESLLIDDGVANVHTAKSLGFQTYLARPFEDFTNLYNRLMKI